ncbi:cell division protein CpoB [Halomonas cupida]|uniref:Cell division coordinator CpoB n=1 Tax=Halomonas cupida TaxID=44933 RepID=A0A1M7B9I7_9GAMM|nr:tol-pal system protein YbgF [Halomonas cupida]GEN22095.1 cell division protein CpoB [Halomonas cupida]SHL51603.1 tol-pal system protein YbgF [Halomonas cupida]
MKHGLKGLCGAGALVLPLSVMVPIMTMSSSALAQQPTIQEIGGSNSIYSQTATRSEAGGSLQLFNQVEGHSRELRELRGQIEELKYQLEQLKQQSRQQYMDLDSRLSEMPSGQAPAADSGSNAEGSSSGNNADGSSSGNSADGSDSRNSGDGRDSASSGNGSSASGEARDAYQSAFSKVQDRNFDQAISEFDSFVERYPDTSLTANAWYWLGELHSAQSSPADASHAFEKVLSDFPDSAKVPDAMYKLGVLKARNGDRDAGLALLRSIKDDYPDSNAAALADQYLRQSGA